LINETQLSTIKEGSVIMVNKDELFKTFQDEIELLHTKFDELKLQASLGKSELKKALQPEIDKIDSQLSDTKKKYAELADVSEDALDDLKEGLTLAISSVSEAVKSVARRFKE